MSRKWKLRLTVEYEKDYPDDWDESMIDFHIYDSSWCADNALEDIKNYLKENNICLCNSGNFEILGEVV